MWWRLCSAVVSEAASVTHPWLPPSQLLPASPAPRHSSPSWGSIFGGLILSQAWLASCGREVQKLLLRCSMRLSLSLFSSSRMVGQTPGLFKPSHGFLFPQTKPHILMYLLYLLLSISTISLYITFLFTVSVPTRMISPWNWEFILLTAVSPETRTIPSMTLALSLLGGPS